MALEASIGGQASVGGRGHGLFLSLPSGYWRLFWCLRELPQVGCPVAAGRPFHS